MNKWVNLSRYLKLRPTIEGLEFITYDKNINLDLSSLKYREQENITALLRGTNPYVNGRRGRYIDSTIKNLKKRGLIYLSNSAPARLTKSEELLWKVRKKFVGNKGPIQRVYWLDPNRSEYYPENAALFSTKYISKTGCKNKRMMEWTSGIDSDPTIAELKAVMEGVERFYSGEITVKELIRAREVDLHRQSVNPTELISYLDKQYRKDLAIEPYSPRKIYYWKNAKIFPTEKDILLPIDLVFYPIDREYAPNLLTFGNSSGIAAGFSYEETLLRSLYEVIERDAFMIVWLNRLSLPKINHISLPKMIQDRIYDIESKGFNVYLIDITLDTAPVVLAIAVNSNKTPVIILGAASNLSILKCIGKALSEIEQGVYWEFRDDSKKIKVVNPKKVLRVKEHISLFRNIKFIQKAEFLWQGKTIPLKDDVINSNDLEKLTALVQKNKGKIIVANITPKLEHLGLVILRAYILGFIPISFGYGLEPLGLNRIYDVPRKLNMKINSWDMFPPLPHPFP